MKSPKELFDKAENGMLTYEQFEEASKTAGAKWADLSEGGYVSKHKYDDDLKAKDTQIETLNTTISTRDTDLEGLRKQLESAGADAGKLTELTNQFTALQNKYDTDTKEYQATLAKQAYEFEVREFANTKKFTSQAAKRDFIQSMIAENLNLKDGKIMGAEDFVTSYTENNADAFVKDGEDGGNAGKGNPSSNLPKFVGSTPGGNPSGADNGGESFANAFHFTGVRPRPESK